MRSSEKRSSIVFLAVAPSSRACEGAIEQPLDRRGDQIRSRWWNEHAIHTVAQRFRSAADIRRDDGVARRH
jgi:hypothetical protein